jgi:hypothetical protein
MTVRQKSLVVLAHRISEIYEAQPSIVTITLVLTGMSLDRITAQTAIPSGMQKYAASPNITKERMLYGIPIKYATIGLDCAQSGRCWSRNDIAGGERASASSMHAATSALFWARGNFIVGVLATSHHTAARGQQCLVRFLNLRFRQFTGTPLPFLRFASYTRR